MPRSSRPRKAYRPRAVGLPTSIRFSPSDETDLQLLPHLDLERFRTGTADSSAWSVLATRVNWGAVLAARHAPEAVERMQNGARALAAVIGRHAAIGRWGVDGAQFRAIADALDVVDQLQVQLTRRELADALRIVNEATHRPERTGELMEILTT